MKYLVVKNCFLIVLTVLLLNGTPAAAQNPFKIDISKTAGKFADWLQKQQENFQTTMEQISESQFATFIGDGIKPYKEGESFVKESCDKIIGAYNNVQDAPVGSKEYQIAMLSKQIADESKVLAQLQEQKENQIASLKAEMELERAALEEKIKQAQENLQVQGSIYQNELQTVVTEQEQAQLEAEIETFKTATESELSGFEEEIARLEEQLEEEIAVVEESFAEQVYAQGEKIAELTKELQELTAGAQETTDSGDAGASIAETINELSFQDDDVISLKDRKNKEEKRRSRKQKAILSAASTSVSNIATVDDKRDEQDAVAATSETMNGKSESVQAAIKTTVSQMENLRDYLRIELKALEAQTMMIITTSTLRTAEPKVVIDICDYEEQKDGAGLSDIIQKGSSIVSSTKDKLNDAKEIVNGAKEQTSEIADTAREIGSAAEDIQNIGIAGIN